MWSVTWKMPSVTNRDPKLLIVGKSESKNDYKNRHPQHLCKQKQGMIRVCWGSTIIMKLFGCGSKAMETAHKIFFFMILSPCWPHQGINRFLSDNLCSTLNLELDTEEE